MELVYRFRTEADKFKRFKQQNELKYQKYLTIEKVLILEGEKCKVLFKPSK